MDIKVLKSFIAVAKHRSFSAAARELNTVQPAISRHISSLEDELGVNLFNRNSRDVLITEAGEQLLKDAGGILSLTEQAKVQVKRAHQGQIGTLNIAYLGPACLTFMATLVRQYKKNFPQVHVTLFEMTATEQIEALKNEQVDVAFSRPLPESINDQYISHNIYIDKLIAVVHQDHAFAEQRNLSLSVFKNQQFILFNRDEAMKLFDEIIIVSKQAGFSPNIISQPKLMQTLVTEVASGLGVGIGPSCIRQLYSEGCQFITLDDVDTEVRLDIQYKKTNNSAIVRAFVDIALSKKTEIRKIINP